MHVVATSRTMSRNKGRCWACGAWDVCGSGVYVEVPIFHKEVPTVQVTRRLPMGNGKGSSPLGS